MKTFDALSETLGLPKMPEEITTLPVIVEPESCGEDLQDDYELTRDTLRSLIIRGNDTLDNMMQIANSTEMPRAFEVAGTMINTIAGTAKELMNLQKQMKELRKGTAAEQSAQVIQTQNNIVFQGSTAELMKQIRQERIIDQDAS
jgi:hypothetical protein